MRAILEQLCQPVSEVIAQHTTAFLDGCADRLLKAADNARSRQEEDECFRMMSVMRQHGNRIADDWRNAVCTQGLALKGNTTPTPVTEGDAPSFDLVDVTSLNDWVAAVKVAADTEDRFADRLYALDRRLAELVGGPIDKESNPFGPVALLGQFQQAIMPFAPSQATEQVILGCLEREILANFGPVYDALNELLVRNGINPDLRLRPVITPAVKAAPRATAESNRHRKTAAQKTPTSPNDQPLTESQADMTKELVRSMHLDQLPFPALDGVVGKLVGPLTELARRQPEFLVDPQHPAALAINGLERLSLFADAQHKDARGESKIKSIIAEVTADLAAADDRDAAFDAAWQKLEPILARQEKLFSANRTRVVDKCRGQERLFQAKRGVNAYLKERLGEGKPPRCLVRLLRLGWESLLTLTWLGEGVDSDTWRGHFKVIEHLSRWFSEKTPGPPKEHEEVERTLLAIEMGFDEISCNPVEQGRLLDHLAKALRGNWPLFRRLQHDRLPALDSAVALIDEAPAQLASDPGWRQTIRSLRVGDWLSEQTSEGDVRRVHLCWIGHDGEHFVFVDARGMEVLDLAFDQLVEALQNGTLELLEQDAAPPIQRSLQNILEREPSRCALREAGGPPVTALSPAHPRRMLYAIMLTDIVGYSRMMEFDEDRAFERLQTHNRVVRQCIERYQGEEIKTIGDAFLLVFSSAVNAVHCAARIHREIGELNRDMDGKLTLALRIGIHVGDVIRLERDVFGDGVNVVARIEPLAEAGSTCISDAVYRLVKKQVELQVEQLQPCPLKNIALPPELYRVILTGEVD